MHVCTRNKLDTNTPTNQMAFLSLLSLVQSLIVWCGLAAGLVACVWGASRGRVSVGDTVLFISMMQVGEDPPEFE
jgi:hypothetical protein